RRAALGPARPLARRACVVVGGEPVLAPLPHVADRLPEPVAVGGEAAHGRRRQPAVGERVRGGEHPLPDVAAPLAVGIRRLVPPRVDGPVEAAARGVLPLSLAPPPATAPTA